MEYYWPPNKPLLDNQFQHFIISFFSLALIKKGDNNEPTAILIVNNDITKRKQAEEAANKLRGELAHIARLSTMGELVASIAHEVNQPLTAISLNGKTALRWLAAPVPDLDEARAGVQQITKDAMRAGEIIKHIRGLIKKVDPEKTSLDINSLIKEVIELLSYEVRRNQLDLALQLDNDIPIINGDRIQLQQVLINLIMNGIEAMNEKAVADRHLVINTKKYDDNVVVEVCDSGHGLNRQEMDQVFNAFFTTKANGMGMGLSISRSIIEEHAGTLSVDSALGQGTTFRFTLPAAKSLVAANR